MAEDKDDEVWKSAESWKAGAVAIAVITPVVSAFSFPWIWAAATDESMLHRVQIVGAGAAFGIALITFCTVVWRGTIATQQAKLQRIQIDRLSAQIAATDENNTALRLQKGAELLGEHGKRSHISAGLMTLQAVATAPKSPFAVEAMNLIADFIDERGKTSHSDTGVQLAITALEKAWRATNLIAERELGFEMATIDDGTPKITNWRIVRGAISASYDEGTFRRANNITEQDASIYFLECRFISSTLRVDGNFFKCKFNLCRINSIDHVTSHEFVKCDFSGALISSSVVPDLREGRNWFDPENPPIAADGRAVDWSQHFHMGKPKSPPRRAKAKA
ncbi:hypothetical protein [Mesorhizobium sp. B2-5-3]|uniref:hypothetical protein n=1 Tax=Mesorhizobium sp. B2-5-3 TaxID=2589927 RepID=UPI00112ECECD|nr:hypothetical protein [Mesorhizobium sp. B2-5-3]TPK38681.1 hypothetical protein FJ867_08730 [Mesorhizobium sp. B2-5-3]